MKISKWYIIVIAIVISILIGITSSYATSNKDKSHEEEEVIIISGTVRNTHGEPVSDAKVEVLINGSLHKPAEAAGEHRESGFMTSSEGGFEAIVSVPKGSAKNARVEIVVSKPSFKSQGPLHVGNLVLAGNDKAGRPRYLSHISVVLPRHIDSAFWIAVIVLVGIYILIAFDIVHRTLASMLGASLMLFISYTLGTFDKQFFIISYERAIHAIDFNVIFLLMGMMIIVGIMKETGVFQWLALKSFQISKGKPFILSIVLILVTAFTSAFLDNVTSMLLLTPVTIEIALVLKLNPFALLLPEVLASNFGGTATLIGDPPNIMIGSYTGLTFNNFVVDLTPVVLITLIAQIIMTKLYYGKAYKAANVENMEGMLVDLRKKYKITNPLLLKYSLFILGFVILLFVTHGVLHMEVSIAALIGASILLLLSKIDIVHVLEKEIEWPTLIFFMTLFIIVGAAEETGLLQIIADWVKNLSHGNIVVAILLIAWVSAIMSAFIDNIPFTATMLPIVAYLSQNIPGADNNVLWWALALGACFGGNGTLVGASANVVTAGLAEKAGYPITFIDFFKVGFPAMIMGMIISSIWLVFILR